MQDEGSVSGASSGASSPEPEAPFIPKFKVRLTDNVNKDGDSVKFTLQVSQVWYKRSGISQKLGIKYMSVFDYRLLEVAENDVLIPVIQKFDNSCSLSYFCFGH